MQSKIKKFALTITAPAVLVSLGGCAHFYGSADHRTQAEGIEACKPITAALQNYRAAYGRYPHNLVELKPKYIESLPDWANVHEIVYRPVDKTYILQTKASRPGVTNECWYSPENKWHCKLGYY